MYACIKSVKILLGFQDFFANPKRERAREPVFGGSARALWNLERLHFLSWSCVLKVRRGSVARSSEIQWRVSLNWNLIFECFTSLGNAKILQTVNEIWSWAWSKYYNPSGVWYKWKLSTADLKVLIPWINETRWLRHSQPWFISKSVSVGFLKAEIKWREENCNSDFSKREVTLQKKVLTSRSEANFARRIR